MPLFEWFKKKKTVYIHAGMSKTGTTSIQKMLSKSEDVLAKNNILYLHSGRENSIAHGAFAAHLKQGRFPELGQRLRDEIDASALSKFIISTELLERTKVEHWQALKALFSPYRVKIIYYLRRQDDGIASMYNELTKKHATGLPFDQYIEASPRVDLLDYKNTLAKIEQVFGLENLNIGVFAPASLYQHDIGKDFMSRIIGDKAVLQSFATPKDNSSLLPATAMLMARINRQIDFNIDHGRHYALACKLAHRIDKILRASGTAKHRYFTDLASRKDFLAQFKESNDYISNRYLERQAFITDAMQQEEPALSETEEVALLRLVTNELLDHAASDENTADSLAHEIALHWQQYLQQAMQAE